MPTHDAEIDTAARRVFAKLPHPTRNGICPGKSCRHADEFHRHDEPWWRPGQVCDDAARLSDVPFIPACRGGAAHWGGPHEIPPPDWRDPAVFLRLLMCYSTIGFWREPTVPSSWSVCLNNRLNPSHANDPRAALILAVAAMLGVE